MPVEKIRVKRRAFDLAKLERVSLVTETTIQGDPPTTVQEALTLAGGDLSKLLNWVASGARDAKIKEVRASIVSPDPNIVFAPGVVLKFAQNFFVYPGVKEQETRKAKYAAAFAVIKANDILMQTLRLQIKEAEEKGEPEPEEEEETES